MKRFHVHVSVKDVSESIRFYSKLFGADPAVIKSDYAKWMLEDPCLNFAISQRGHAPGINHLGFQVDSGGELQELRAQVARAEMVVVDEGGAACCYAKSDKYWVEDPQGIAWEVFHTLGGIPVFGEPVDPAVAEGACCVPLARQVNERSETACCVPATESTSGKGCCA